MSKSKSSNSSNSDSIEERRREIESELDEIQKELDSSIGAVKDDVTKQFTPKEFIKRHPLTSVGISMLAGFFIGSSGRQRKTRGSSASHTSKKGDGLGNMVWDEVKSTVSKKAVSMLVDYIDKNVQQKLDEIDPNRDTNQEE